ncbi:MAG: hypothetical protein JSR80_08285 [Verrucomicrobia bacterium]|nr:hypothetical protein [Verrucomicrobiota bacterium]
MTIDAIKEQLRTVEQKMSPPPLWWMLKALSVAGGAGGALYAWRAASRLSTKMSRFATKMGALALATGAITAAYFPYPISEEEKKVANEQMVLKLYQLILHKDATEQEIQGCAKRLSHLVPVLRFVEMSQASPQLNAEEIMKLLHHFPHATLDLSGAPRDLLEGVCVMAIFQVERGHPDPRLCKAVRFMNWNSHLKNVSTSLEALLPHFPSLEELNLYDMRLERLTQEMVEKILSDHSQLRRLDLPVDLRKEWMNKAFTSIEQGEELTPFHAAYLRVVHQLEWVDLSRVEGITWRDATIAEVIQKMPALQEVNFSELNIAIAPLTLQKLRGLTSLQSLQLPSSWIEAAVEQIVSQPEEIGQKFQAVCALTEALEPKLLEKHVKSSEDLCIVLNQFCNLKRLGLGGSAMGEIVNVSVMQSIQRLESLESLTLSCGDTALGALPKGCPFVELSNAFKVTGEGIALLLQSAPQELKICSNRPGNTVPNWSESKKNFSALKARYKIKDSYLNLRTLKEGEEIWEAILDNHDKVFSENSYVKACYLHLIAQKEEIL